MSQTYYIHTNLKENFMLLIHVKFKEIYSSSKENEEHKRRNKYEP